VDAVRPARLDWTLDRRGNWSQTQEYRNGGTAPAQTRQADGKNEYTLLSQIVAPPDGLWSQVPEYDLAGNLLFEPRSPLSGNSTGDVDSLRYAYDEENRLIEVRRDQDNALLAKYTYDALGRRVQTLDYTASASSPCINTSSPLITRHLMAGLQTLEETVHCALATGGSGDQLVREFVWGRPMSPSNGPEPVAMVTHGGGAGGQGGPAVPAGVAVFYYLHDILGSVLALADAAGNVVERYSYDPYGKTLIERHNLATGTWSPTTSSSFGNPHGWTGQRYDAPVGLYHFLFRSYSPTLGRWLQRDPAGYVDGINLYHGMLGSPLNYVDPLGLTIWDVAKGIGEGIIDLVKGLANVVLHPNKTGEQLADAACGQYFEFREAGDGITSALFQTGLVGLANAMGLEAITDFVEGRDRYGNPLSQQEAWRRLTVGLAQLGSTAIAVKGGVVALLDSEGNVIATVRVSSASNDAALLERYLSGSGGRWGSSRTRLLNDRIATMWEQEGWNVVRGAGRASEEWIAGPNGGLKGGTWVDITLSKDGVTIRIQTVDTLADGITPIAREIDAAKRIQTKFPKDKLILIPKE